MVAAIATPRPECVSPHSAPSSAVVCQHLICTVLHTKVPFGVGLQVSLKKLFGLENGVAGCNDKFHWH